MKLNHLLVEDVNGVRRITLNRPKSLNALNYEVIGELEVILHESDMDEQVRVVILNGSGRAFCAGDDLKGMGTEKIQIPDQALRRSKLGYSRLIMAIRSLDKPVLAEVHGFALGAGCDIALACDMIFAADDAQFGLVFAKRGLVSGTILLPKLVGYHKACEILFTGDHITAQKAQELGLVNYVTRKEELSRTVETFAEKLANAPTGAIGMMKRAINQSVGETLERSIDIQDYIVACSYHTHDYHEGKRAFQEKRTPNYLGK